MSLAQQVETASSNQAGANLVDDPLLHSLSAAGLHGPLAEAVAEDDEAVLILLREGAIKTF